MEVAQNVGLEEARAELKKIIDENQSFLDQLQEEIDQTKLPRPAATRRQIANGDHAAAFEARKRDLAFLLAGPRPTDCHPNAILSNQSLLVCVARRWQSHSRTEMQQTLMEEKQQEALLKEEIEMKMTILNEHQMILNALWKKKKALEELAAAELRALKEQVDDLEEISEAMKIILGQAFEKYFRGPEIPGYTPMYMLMQHLVKPLRLRRRSTYIRVKDSIWPYYLEILESYGIIEHHPVDKGKIRLVDFSGGHLGLSPEAMEAIKGKEEEKKKAKAEKRERERREKNDREKNYRKITKENALERILQPRRIVSRGKIVSKGIPEKSTKYWKKGEESTQEEEDWEDLE